MTRTMTVAEACLSALVARIDDATHTVTVLAVRLRGDVYGVR